MIKALLIIAFLLSQSVSSVPSTKKDNRTLNILKHCCCHNLEYRSISPIDWDLCCSLWSVCFPSPKISKRPFALTSPLAIVDTIKIRIYLALRNKERKVHCLLVASTSRLPFASCFRFFPHILYTRHYNTALVQNIMIHLFLRIYFFAKVLAMPKPVSQNSIFKELLQFSH